MHKSKINKSAIYNNLNGDIEKDNVSSKDFECTWVKIMGKQEIGRFKESLKTCGIKLQYRGH